MKILREKVFFDYKGYAEKFGKSAAKAMKQERNALAGSVRSFRQDSDGMKKIATSLGNSKLGQTYQANAAAARDKAKSILSAGKSKLSKLWGGTQYV